MDAGQSQQSLSHAAGYEWAGQGVANRSGEQERPPASKVEAVERDIEHTRRELDTTIGAIQHRLSPRNLANETKIILRNRSIVMRQRITRLVRNHPIPSVITGVGLSWLAGSALRDRGKGRAGGGGHPPATAMDAEQRARTHLYQAGMETQGSAYAYEPGELVPAGGEPAAGESVGQRAGEKASEVAERTREYGQQVREQGRQMGEQARQRTAEVASRTRERGRQMSAGLQRQARQIGQSSQQTFEQHPLTLGFGVFAMGLLAGLLIPSTRREDALMGEQRDRLMAEAQSYGEQLLERGQAAAEQTAETATQRMEERGEQLAAELGGEGERESGGEQGGTGGGGAEREPGEGRSGPGRGGTEGEHI